MKSFKQFLEECEIVNEDDDTSEDKKYYKDGKEYTLHRAGDKHHLIHQGKRIESYGADPKSVHQHLDKQGYRLSNQHFKAGSDWFKEEATI